MDLSRLKLEPHKLFHHLVEVTKWQRGEYFSPIYIEFSPIDICNQKCWFCYTEYMGHKKMEIEGDLLVEIFNQLGEAGVKSVQIQGTGEPLLNKALPEAISAGKKAGLSLSLGTNGVLLNKEVLDKILPCLSWLRVSAIECNPKLYVKTHRCPESHWEMVIEALKSAVKIRNRDGLDTVIGVHFIPFDYNAKYVLDTAKMCKEIGIDYILVKTANQSIHNPEHIWRRDIYIRYREAFEKTAKLQSKEFVVRIRWDQFDVQKECGPFKKNYKACYGMEFETMIDSDAKVYPCLHFWRDKRYCLGDLRKKSFEEIWKSKHRRKVLNDIYSNFNLNKCHFLCKHHHINTDLWELANPPIHKNFL